MNEEDLNPVTILDLGLLYYLLAMDISSRIYKNITVCKNTFWLYLPISLHYNMFVV